MGTLHIGSKCGPVCPLLMHSKDPNVLMLSLSDPARSFSHSVSSAREYLPHAFFAAR